MAKVDEDKDSLRVVSSFSALTSSTAVAQLNSCSHEMPVLYIDPGWMLRKTFSDKALLAEELRYVCHIIVPFWFSFCVSGRFLGSVSYEDFFSRHIWVGGVKKIP